MRRREFVAGISVAGMAWPLGLSAQPTSKLIFGILLVFSREGGRTFTDPIRAYLEALGYVDGRNIELDFRHADGKVDRLPIIATELVARRPAVIATFGDATGLAAQAATTVIPYCGDVRGLGRGEARQGYATSGCEYHRGEHHGHRA